MTHTPGPWKADVAAKHVVQDPDGFLIATVESPEEWPEPRAEADCYLLAAAPDLLEALKKLVADYEEVLPLLKFTPAGRQAYAAIAKAEGKASGTEP